MHIHGDNSAMISIIRSGRNPTMRQLCRTHGIILRWLHDEAINGRTSLTFISTELMRADIFTKFYPNSKLETWTHVCRLVNLHDSLYIIRHVGSPGQGHHSIVSDAECSRME